VIRGPPDCFRQCEHIRIAIVIKRTNWHDHGAGCHGDENSGAESTVTVRRVMAIQESCSLLVVEQAHANSVKEPGGLLVVIQESCSLLIVIQETRGLLVIV
jgi:hypothetical protein